MEQFLAERGLELSPEKTLITSIADGFDFLGQTVRKYNGKLRIKPSKKNVKTFLDKVRTVIKTNKQLPAGELIRQLNPKIRGWANYHRHVVSKVTFSSVDRAIHHCLWQWARRRHPNKAYHWIRKKYFCTQNGNNWTFFGSVCSAKGEETRYYLVTAAKTPIVRHTKIKGDANPYAPEWETYFEARLGVHMANNLRGRRQLSRLWREQGGQCPVCNQPITKLTGWHNHHLKQRVMGGLDTSENRVLLHPNCHRKVHAQGIAVSKPRPSRGVTRA